MPISERDLTIAERLGSIDQGIKNLTENLDKERVAIWGKLESHDEKISKQNAMMRWTFGLVAGISMTLEAIRHWMKT